MGLLVSLLDLQHVAIFIPAEILISFLRVFYPISIHTYDAQCPAT
jgi:hypothetical protein